MMRAMLERSRSARLATSAIAAVAVMSLVHAASAGDDLGLRRAELWPSLWGEPAEAAAPEPQPAAPPRARRARRIWAASARRPLRITLRRARARVAVAAPRRAARSEPAARPRIRAEPAVAFSKFITLPRPAKPAIVSIYEDSTLRNGDAVMLADGIHVFHALGAWPYRPRDFVALTRVAGLDWRLRTTLSDLDKNPPMRWSSTSVTSG